MSSGWNITLRPGENIESFKRKAAPACFPVSKTTAANLVSAYRTLVEVNAERPFNLSGR